MNVSRRVIISLSLAFAIRVYLETLTPLKSMETLTLIIFFPSTFIQLFWVSKKKKSWYGLVPQLSDFQQSSSLLWNVLQDFLYLLLIPPSHWGDFVLIAHQTGKRRMSSQAAIQPLSYTPRICLGMAYLGKKKSFECSGSVFPNLISGKSGMRIAEGRTIPAKVRPLPASSSIQSMSRTVSSIRILKQKPWLLFTLSLNLKVNFDY